jgi:hypothetical protein
MWGGRKWGRACGRQAFGVCVLASLASTLWTGSASADYSGPVRFSPQATFQLKLDRQARRGTVTVSNVSLYCQDGSSALSPQLSTTVRRLGRSDELAGVFYSRDPETGDRLYLDVEGKTRGPDAYRGTLVVVLAFGDSRPGCSASDFWNASRTRAP